MYESVEEIYSNQRHITIKPTCKEENKFILSQKRKKSKKKRCSLFRAQDKQIDKLVVRV